LTAFASTRLAAAFLDLMDVLLAIAISHAANSGGQNGFAP
jgi:hypothetical protein